MNLRQKAKHFKKLYEEGLPKKPYPVIRETYSVKHRRVRVAIDKIETVYGEQRPQMLQSHIENEILKAIRPIIWDNLIAEQDPYTGKIIYTLDLWM